MPDKDAGSRAGRRRTIMRALKINEISGVDMPAQQGAVAVIMKRHEGAPQTGRQVGKRAWLTTSVEGHAHLVDEETYDGRFRDAGDTSWTRSEGDDSGHSHPWVRDRDGSITIGEAEGHTHETVSTEKRTFSAKERERLAESGEAMADGGFPIVTKADLANAIQAFGRAKNKAAVARHIKRRASALKATDVLPEEGALADLLKAAGDTGDEVGTKETDPMPDPITKEDHDAAILEIQKKLDRATVVGSMNDAQKAHLGTLDGDAADEFLAKSAEDRQRAIDDVAQAAQDDDPVVYTTLDGVEMRKSIGEGFIAMAKSNDALRGEVTKLTDEKLATGYEKRAEDELAHIPGDVGTRAAMLKAIEGIGDETQREAALNALKAQNEAMSKAFEAVGHGGSPAPGSPDEQLDGLAKKHQGENSGTTYAQAYDAVLKTDAGAELYAKSIN